jgi:spoIIIJ-associated protein
MCIYCVTAVKSDTTAANFLQLEKISRVKFLDFSERAQVAFDLYAAVGYQWLMNEVDAAEKILLSMLAKLGFEANIERDETADGPSLNIITNDGKHLIGKNGDRLEDLQYLTNRILNKHYPDAPRIHVDCDRYRAEQEERLVELAQNIAKQVAEDGKTRKLKPLNAYYRRLAHNALAEIDGIQSNSPMGSGRYKRIEVSKA